MNNIARPRWASVDYWEAGARWYDLWLRHNRYHEPVKAVLAARIRPDWRILDVGGGSGVLSLFLRELGCRIVLLEPAAAMRALFFRDAAGEALAGCEVEPLRWEDIESERLAGFDLILACNSLHVSSLGFDAALEKVFAARPRHVCVVAERAHASRLGRRPRPEYSRVFSDRRDVPSSRVYHSPEEALEEAAFLAGRPLSSDEKMALLGRLAFENEHYRLEDTASISLEWWTRMTREG